MGPIAALLTALAVVAVQPAPAVGGADDVRVSLIAPAVEGEMEPERRALLVSRISAGLTRAGLQVETQSTSSGEVEACETVECRRDLAEAQRARYVVFAQVVASLRDYEFAFTLVDGRTGKVAGEASEVCSPCGFADATQMAERLATQLRRKLEQELSAPAIIRIETTPTGALVEVDGEPVGPAPAQVQVQPGDHVARATLKSWRPGELRFAATAGVAQTLELELIPAESGSPAPDPSRVRRRRAGWALAGVGAAMSVAGGVLLGFNGRPVRTRCSGSDVDIDGNCRSVHRSLPYGVPTLVVGVGMLAAGIGLLATRRRR